MMIKITIVFDNSPPVIEGLQSDWGFAALVEVGADRRILFDTGADGKILLDNMAVLGIDPASIDDVFISHAHHDHTGGLADFLSENDRVKIWAPPSMGRMTNPKEVIFVADPRQLYKGIYSTGELEGIEQSLAVTTNKGLLLVVGCSHPRMETILDTASHFGDLYGIVGGLHSSQPESLRGLGLICATHCTQQKADIKRLYPDSYVVGGAGTIIEIQ